MSGIRHLEVRPTDGEPRLDRFLKRHFPRLSQGHLQKLLRKGELRVDGRRAEASTRLAPGQTVRVPPLDETAGSGEARPKPARETQAAKLTGADVQFARSLVLHDDGTVVVLNKPAGLAVQGGSKTTRHIDRLLPALDLAGERCRLVHRLDRDTAGLLVVARGADAAAFLTDAFKRGTVRKLYWALVRGKVKESQGLINLRLEKAGGPGRERMQGGDDGKPAKTVFRVVQNAGRIATWLALRPITGRTHQLRAHCAAIGNPILGDAKYADQRGPLNGQPEGLMLFAREIELPHPKGRMLRLSAPLPPHLKAGFDFLGFAAEAGRAHDLEAFDV